MRNRRYGIRAYTGRGFSTGKGERLDGKPGFKATEEFGRKAFAKVEEENQEPKKKNDPPGPAVYITAPKKVSEASAKLARSSN